ncbi:alpha/beta hydrolase family protein [Devosia sediminis]|uniref:Uncharacterized protein n=1 Tax=Devosia sediminis TaxID=2798801 RepID=A0A934MRC6_9HYPH|nr:hypothetical protein [Devosia sediminis]MBJ3785284.1 hypothetical protein [Devosia sediminis]
MRPIETLLLLDTLFMVLALVVSRLRQPTVLITGAAFATAFLLLHLLLEGYRWQMVPAYGLCLLLGLGIVLHTWPASRWRWSRPFSIASGAVLLVAWLLPNAVPMFQLPDPSGPYASGSLTYHFVDPGRSDWVNRNAPRELMVQVWYPVAKAATGEREPYIPHALDFGGGLGNVRLPGFFLDHLTLVETHALRAAPMAAGLERFPLLIFSPGANGYRQHNMFQVEELVSHGYVVAAIDHPGAARAVVFPDGRRMPHDATLMNIPRFFAEPGFGEAIFNYLAGDVSFALDQIMMLDAHDPRSVLTGRIDTARVGVFGVSLGGLVAAEACRQDDRIAACLIEDVFVPADVIADGVDQPTMWLSRDADSMRAERWTEAQIGLHQTSMHAALEGSRTDGYIVSIPGTFHLNFTDLPFTLSEPLAKGLGLTGSIDWRRGHHAINAFSTAFFDRYLKGESSDLLLACWEQFPEVDVISRIAGMGGALWPH